MNLFKIGAVFCLSAFLLLALLFTTNIISSYNTNPEQEFSIKNLNAQLDLLFDGLIVSKDSNSGGEYLQPAEGRVFSWWPAKEELQYEDLYSVITFVLEKCPVDIPDKAGFTSLLIETIATESFFGSTNVQRRGHALGVIQMEPATHSCLYDNYMKYHPHLKTFVTQFKDANMTDIENLKVNLQYQIAIATVQYIRRNGHTQDLQTISARYAVYKAIYNTHLGKATQDIYEFNIGKYLASYYAEK